jgi:NMD protein affecting ribosome stability and mRNA decay
MRVVEIHDGLDFHFKERNDAVKFVEFVQAKFIIKQKQSKELISSNA